MPSKASLVKSPLHQPALAWGIPTWGTCSRVLFTLSHLHHQWWPVTDPPCTPLHPPSMTVLPWLPLSHRHQHWPHPDHPLTPLHLPCMAVLHQRLLSHPHQRWPLPGPPPSRLHPPRMAALHQLPCRVTRILACPCATVCSHPWRCNIIHMQLWVMHLSCVQHLQ